jgi:cytochrome oxidase assembly protein ShyY1
MLGTTNYPRRVRFLLSRRWVLFALVVAFLAWVATQLGQWQFSRLEDRKSDNRIVSANLDRPPAPIDDVLSTERAPRPDDEWRRVTVHGTWDEEHTIVLKYQTRDQGAGVDVVTPLVTENGPAVLVDRGWVSTGNTGGSRPDLPRATEGRVTVTGWVRRDATGNATKVSDLSTRAISSEEIAEVTPYPLYRGFLDLAEESPEPTRRLELTELPDDTSNGPHFFYGLQWWFFGALAVFGFCYLAWDEFRQHRRRRQDDVPPEQGALPDGPSERPERASVHGKHHAGHEG